MTNESNKPLPLIETAPNQYEVCIDPIHTKRFKFFRWILNLYGIEPKMTGAEELPDFSNPLVVKIDKEIANGEYDNLIMEVVK